MQLFHGPLTAVLCLSLITPAGSAQSLVSDSNQPTKHNSGRTAYHSTELRGDARILHALNRFTFGPRPGDVDAVRAMGLDKWFEQQLHPATIGEADLNARLAEFPAMQWNPQELLFRVPSNAIIRQTLDGKIPVPERGALHAVYENQMFRVSAKRQEKEQKKDDGKAKQQVAPNSGAVMAAGVGNGDGTQAQASSQEQGSMDASPMNVTKVAPVILVDDGQFRRMLDLAPQQRVLQLVAMQPEAFDTFFKSLKPQQRNALVQDLSPDLKEVVLDLENPQRLVNEEIIAQRLTRAIYTNAQLQEVMTDFWLNHFNVFLHKNEATPYYLVSFERDVIRPRALGKFEDLLEATAHSPAMMLYLDNASSIGPDSMAAERAERRPNNKKKRDGLNENYARELMELHTLGVNGGYSQADVTQVARILTGWGVERPERGGGFQFEPNRHEPGTKIVMNEKFKEHGEQEGRDLLHMLATRPATAQFISHKLAVRFVSDDPPQALVDRMAKTFLSTDGDITAVMSTLFHSPEFWDSNVYRAKVKTPIEFVVSAARAGNADIENMQPLANAVREMGMPLYGCVTPNGYTWQSDAWVSTNALVNRMNFALSLAANRLPGISIAWDPTENANNDTAMLETNPAAPDPQVEESRLESLIVTGGVSDSTRAAVLQQFEQQRNQTQNAAVAMPVATMERQKFRARVVTDAEKQDQVLAGLLLGSPEFQRR
jgi:uncharacterized protein (DUF1800 family)